MLKDNNFYYCVTHRRPNFFCCVTLRQQAVRVRWVLPRGTYSCPKNQVGQLIRGAFEMAKTSLHSTAELDDGVLCARDRSRLPRVPANLDTIRRRESYNCKRTRQRTWSIRSSRRVSASCCTSTLRSSFARLLARWSRWSRWSRLSRCYSNRQQVGYRYRLGRFLCRCRRLLLSWMSRASLLSFRSWWGRLPWQRKRGILW